MRAVGSRAATMVAATLLWAGLSIPLFAAGGGGDRGGESAASPLREIRWLASGVPVQSLARSPVECLGTTKIEADARSIAIGRAAFRTPALLGRLAARAGLSCASCHRNGRTNANFHFPGLSGEPGTSDVTSAVTSSHRDDGKFNPKPIPDLAAPIPMRIVSRDTRSGALEKFIRSAITEEFDGAKPPPRVLAGLAAYVRAISPAACPAYRVDMVLLHKHTGEISEALGASLYAWQLGDRATARLMIASARTSLGLIDERYAPLPPSLAKIRAADAELASIEAAIEEGAQDVPARLASWRTDMVRWLPTLKNAEARSLFNPVLLARYNR